MQIEFQDREKPQQAVTGHTPGPWNYDESLAGTIFINAGDETIAATSVMARASFSDIAIANARLIAAAPDLLAALKFCLENLVRPDGEAAREAKNAIAKAEGRAEPAAPVKASFVCPFSDSDLLGHASVDRKRLLNSRPAKQLTRDALQGVESRAVIAAGLKECQRDKGANVPGVGAVACGECLCKVVIEHVERLHGVPPGSKPAIVGEDA